MIWSHWRMPSGMGECLAEGGGQMSDSGWLLCNYRRHVDSGVRHGCVQFLTQRMQNRGHLQGRYDRSGDAVACVSEPFMPLHRVLILAIN